MSYLKHLPVHKLKIDQSFVRALPENKDDVAIAKTIIALGSNMNMRVIAEGVETETQADFLRNEGCEEVQGYYYGHPVSAEEFERILREQR